MEHAVNVLSYCCNAQAYYVELGTIVDIDGKIYVENVYICDRCNESCEVYLTEKPK